MPHVDPMTIIVVALFVALLMLVIGSVAFHWGHDAGYRDGQSDARKARASYRRTLGAMWPSDDWLRETQPHERMKGWRERHD